MATIYANQIPEVLVGEIRTNRQTFSLPSGNITDGFAMKIFEVKWEESNLTLSIRGHCVGEFPPVMPANNYIGTKFASYVPSGATLDYTENEPTNQAPYRFVHRETYRVIGNRTVTEITPT